MIRFFMIFANSPASVPMVDFGVTLPYTSNISIFGHLPLLAIDCSLAMFLFALEEMMAAASRVTSTNILLTEKKRK